MYFERVLIIRSISAHLSGNKSKNRSCNYFITYCIVYYGKCAAAVEVYARLIAFFAVEINSTSKGALSGTYLNLRC